QKAVLRLLDVHKKLINDGFDHNIYIVGDGPQREELEEKIKKYGVESTFNLLGKRENPYPYIKAADYFMLMSYYEGYPMVLLEGKALNKYILMTDSAARETLIGYNDSMIVKNNEKGIYEGIKELIEKKPKALKKNKDMNKEILDEVISLIDGEV
ncbi:MAG: glycosyltransferase, partial [Bacilli bacterium]|nr:glycosyltransferase [Bacilli bacterium]